MQALGRFLLQSIARGVHAQCPLATVRNIRRQEKYPVSRLAEYCLMPEYRDDIRLPDWPMLLQPVALATEVVQRIGIDSISAEEMSDFRVMAVAHRNHVVAIINKGSGEFRVYDNDSVERLDGTYSVQRADEIMDARRGGGMIFGLLDAGSDLNTRLGPPVTTLRPPVRRAPRRPTHTLQPWPSD